MALSTYSELQASVIAWSSRSDLATLVPDFIRLAEDRMNRSLRVKQMEEVFYNTVVDCTMNLESGTVGIKSIWIEGKPESPLLSRSYDEVLRLGTTGTPTAWAWQGDTLYFDGDADVQGVRYKEIPALSDEDDTNWLLTSHPTAYLYGSLAEVFSYTRNMPQAEQFRLRFEAALGDIMGADMRDRFAGPLQVRVR